MQLCHRDYKKKLLSQDCAVEGKTAHLGTFMNLVQESHQRKGLLPLSLGIQPKWIYLLTDTQPSLNWLYGEQSDTRNAPDMAVPD